MYFDFFFLFTSTFTIMFLHCAAAQRIVAHDRRLNSFNYESTSLRTTSEGAAPRCTRCVLSLSRKGSRKDVRKGISNI